MSNQAIREPSTAARPAPAGRWVDARVTYLADTSIKPVTYNPPQGTGVPRRDGNYGCFPVRIHDARRRALSLDREGFILVDRDTTVRDFYDEAELSAVYFGEV